MTKPNEVIISDDMRFRIPDQLYEAINEYMADNYGEVPSAYGLEIVLNPITWEEEL